tara:strand:+ start:8259 stop:8546 length:288 start_codon:yes stop_codon:yes gene_type:complete
MIKSILRPSISLSGSRNKLESICKKGYFCTSKKDVLNIDLAKYFLPDGILDYFEIVADTLANERVHFYLEEKNILPKEYESEVAQSKGFSPEITV